MRVVIAILGVLFTFGTNAQTALFSGAAIPSNLVLPVANNYTWAPGLTYGLSGGIPTRNTSCATLSPLGGGLNDTTQINAAITACTVGQVVSLNAGTFTVTCPNNFILLNKAVTLRGAGAGVTTISKPCGATATTVGMHGTVGSSPDPLILVGPIQFSSGTDPTDPTGPNFQAIKAATNLTADALAGQNNLSVTSTTGLSNGQYVIVDQASPGGWQVDTVTGNNPITYNSTITMTCASPSVVTWGAGSHGMGYGTAIQFTGGTLCTGFSSSTNYYITNDSLLVASTPTKFHLSDTQAHAIAGTNTIAGTGSSSGTITAAMQGATQIWIEPVANGGTPLEWKKHNPTQQFVDDFDNFTYPTTANSNGDQYSRLNRPRNELCKITNIVSLTVTCEKPLVNSYLAANTAQVAQFTPTFVEQAGVESLTLTGGDDDNIQIKWCGYCWAKNIESTIWVGQGIDFFDCYYCELRASYSHIAADAEPGGGAYAIAMDFATTGCLIENNISILSNKVVVARAGGAGCVVGYNYFDDAYINYQETWIEMGANASHFSGPSRVLFEGNFAQNLDSDNTHGTSNYISYFRNWSRGFRSTFTNPFTGNTVNDSTTSSNGPFRAYGPQSYGTFFAAVCNVAGTSGGMSGWVFSNNVWGNGQQSIWQMGWDNTTAGINSIETTAQATIYRAGNWDWLNSQQTWQNGTNGQVFPTSLYQTSQPAWYSGTYPWVNCVNGSTGALNSSSNLPAIARYYNGTPNVTPND